MLHLLAVAIALLASTRSARADGMYFTESFGVALPRGELRPLLAQPMKARLAVGMRVGWFALEPWMGASMQLEREGAFRGFIGGDPPEGLADLSAYGVDAKLIGRLDQRLSAYVRGGPSVVEGSGALAGYTGYGVGASTGLVLSGRVRALGFLWTPLFFTKRGPLVTGALYLDTGMDFYQLRMANAKPIDGRAGHVSIGFAVGSDF